MNDETLSIIGRGHNSAEIYKAYKKAREFDFCINMDLIGGLPDEDCSCFVDGLNKVIELAPENITVHSLSKKRAADRAHSQDVSGGPENDFTRIAYDILKANGYFPYYLYRQSNCAGDNIGYTCSHKHVNMYNVLMMDESATVFGAGCAAASRIGGVKSYNPKYPYEYISRRTTHESAVNGNNQQQD
jgi:oxygen-independent coproporphyrinogen-3 oxidase